MSRSSQQSRTRQESQHLKKPPANSQNDHDAALYFFAAVAALGSLLLGYDTGLIGGAELSLRKDFGLTPLTEELVVSAILIGGIVGAGVSGKLSNGIGRKWSLTIVGILFAVGAILTALAPNVEAFVAFRILVGFCVGIASMVSPVYITEISPPSKRGSLVTFNRLMLTCAIPLGYGVDLAFAHAHIGWRPMFGVEAIPGVILAIGMFFLPDTPRWLASKGRWEQARQALERVAGEKRDDELQAIGASIEKRKHTSIRELFLTGLRMALVVGIGLGVFQQLVGTAAISYYTPTIFKLAGFKSSAGDMLATIATAVATIIATIIAIFLLDRLGRRPLLFASLSGIIIALVIMGIIALFGSSILVGYLMLVCLLIYAFAYAIGLGPIFSLMCSEIFPTALRGAGVSISVCINWIATLLVGITFLSLIKYLGVSWTFWLYAVLALGAFIFCWFLVPETKGENLEQIEQHWEK